MSSVQTLTAACVISLSGYLALAAVPDWAHAWERTLSILAVLIVAYLLGIRGGLGGWRFPFLGFSADPRAGEAKPGSADEPSGRLEERKLVLVWVGAVVFRGLLLVHDPSLSDDLYRYLWDGRVLLAGINPYRYPPDAPELAALRDALWPAINHPSLPTIYPPLCLVLFALVAAISPTVLAWKIAATALDLAAGFGIQRALSGRGLPRIGVVVYLWHPLVVLEFAGNGHVDAAGLALVAAALAMGSGSPSARGTLRAGIALTLAGLIKFLPWVALPALGSRLRVVWWWLPLIVVAFYLPFVRHGVHAWGSLGVYAATWRANDLLFGLAVGTDPGPAELLRAKLGAAAIVAAVWGILLWRRCAWPSVYAGTVGTLLLVSPVVHPWYLTWLVPVCVFVRQPAWWVWSLTVFLAYAPLPLWKAQGVWEESLAHKFWEVAPVLALLPLQVRWGTRGKPGAQPRPASPGGMPP